MICRNKSKLLPNSFPGVYQLDCTCNALYIGETKKKVITRTIEHQQDSFNGKWESSGATEHCLECHGQFNWINPKTLSIEQQYRRRKVREWRCRLFFGAKLFVDCGPASRLNNAPYGYFLVKRWLCGLGQHCISNFLVQCCLIHIWTTLNIWYSCAMFS